MSSREKVYARVTRGFYGAILIVLCGVIGTPVLADNAAKSSAPPPRRPPRAWRKHREGDHGRRHYRYRLSNGLRVLLFPDQSKPPSRSTSPIWWARATRTTGDRYGAFAGAFAVQGASKNPSIVQQFNQRGMRMNGTTWLDRTNYFELFHASDTT